MKAISHKKWYRQERRHDIAFRRLQEAAQAGAHVKAELMRASAELLQDDADNDHAMEHVINALQETLALHHRLVSAASWLGYPASTLLDSNSRRNFIGIKGYRK